MGSGCGALMNKERNIPPIAACHLMSRLEAINEYNKALKSGKKYYSTALSRGENPYPRVLDEEVSQASTSAVNLGLVEVPIDRIVGTWTGGRMKSFAGNFMPLMEQNTEFAEKWINLCVAHLFEGGITDPIKCYEYMGNFYVQEGHKRVSVLKNFGATDITGNVTRLVPPRSDDPETQLYYEFVNFYKASKLYTVSFSKRGSYAKLQAYLGLEPDQEWPDEVRRPFNNVITRFSTLYNQMNSERLPLTAGDALMVYLQVYPYTELQKQSDEEIKKNLTKLWPDVRLHARGEPISVSTEPEEKGKSLISKILGTPRLNIAFIYDFDPKTSIWASAHEQGEQYLREQREESVGIQSYLCLTNPTETMEEAIHDGANVIFATTPTLIDSCRIVAASHKNIAVFNCSLSMPYTGVRSYYPRVYEAKFISGAIAGAMAKEDLIGYISSYPIMGSIAAINAFALGAQLTNPRAKISLKWTCLPGDPVSELTGEGITVISNRDPDGSKLAPNWFGGTFRVKPDRELQTLASPCWNWGIYYDKTVQSLLNGGIEAVRDSHNAINDWWGMSTGVVDLEIGEDLPEGLCQLSEYLKRGIVNGIVDPFKRQITDQQGNIRNDGTQVLTSEELMQMDWLCENVDGIIPSFEELIPQSQNLVRLLGIYRSQIPPKPDENAL